MKIIKATVKWMNYYDDNSYESEESFNLKEVFIARNYDQLFQKIKDNYAFETFELATVKGEKLLFLYDEGWKQYTFIIEEENI